MSMRYAVPAGWSGMWQRPDVRHALTSVQAFAAGLASLDAEKQDMAATAEWLGELPPGRAVNGMRTIFWQLTGDLDLIERRGQELREQIVAGMQQLGRTKAEAEQLLAPSTPTEGLGFGPLAIAAIVGAAAGAVLLWGWKADSWIKLMLKAHNANGVWQEIRRTYPASVWAQLSPEQQEQIYRRLWKAQESWFERLAGNLPETIVMGLVAYGFVAAITKGKLPFFGTGGVGGSPSSYKGY